MFKKTKKIIFFEIILTIAAVGQIILSFFLYNQNGQQIIRNIGWLLLMLSAIFGWLPIYYFKKWGKVPKGKGYVYTTVLVDRGIYAIVRHPQYAAGILMAMALFLVVQHWFIGILGIVLIYIYWYSAFDEERNAIEKFGENYKQYMKSVPRFNFLCGLYRYIFKR